MKRLPIIFFVTLTLTAVPVGSVWAEVTWGGLLQKARGKKAVRETTEETAKPSPKEAHDTDELEAQWKKALASAGYSAPGTHGVVKTRYPGGELQSERIFNKGVIENLKWYSPAGVLLFEGEFEEGKLVRRKRYKPDGELESVWP